MTSPSETRPGAQARATPSDLAAHWQLEPGLDFLNHGSFGACPTAVLGAQSELRRQIEAQPVRFLGREHFDRLDAARARLAAFLGADPECLVAVTNATAGVNTVLRSLDLAPGDEVVTTNHAYNACRNAVEFVARRAAARVVVAEVPFPLSGPAEVVEAVLRAVSPRTRLAVLDHVTSPTGLVFPARELTERLAERGVDTLIDGAHAPGMVDLALDDLGAAYYTGNCHKWLCAPKGAAFLHVRRDRADRVEPLVVSHGLNQRRPGRSRLHDAFDWSGTDDPTPFLCVPVAIDTLAALVPGGWPELRARNHQLAVAARRILVGSLGCEAPCPETMLGSLASLPLPDATGSNQSVPGEVDPLQEILLRSERIEVPVMAWPALPHRLLRISAQLYNHEDQYRRLAGALRRNGVAFR